MTPRIPWFWSRFVEEFERRADAAVTGLPLRQTSWGRTRSRNAKVGGASASQHLVWTAVDFTGSAAAKREAIARAKRLGLIAVDEGDHLHIQLFARGVIPAWVFDQVAA